MDIILSTAYWPPLSYLKLLLGSNKVIIDGYEHYEKQSYRNRCKIFSANGVLPLSIPVEHPGKTRTTREVRVSGRSWRAQHLTAIKSAYGKSPYFMYFEDELIHFYETADDNLMSLNLQQLQLLKKVFRIDLAYELSAAYVEPSTSLLDLRQAIHPKKNSEDLPAPLQLPKTPYYQGFSDKWGFQADLSCLDLLFHLGPQGLAYLR